MSYIGCSTSSTVHWITAQKLWNHTRLRSRSFCSVSVALCFNTARFAPVPGSRRHPCERLQGPSSLVSLIQLGLKLKHQKKKFHTISMNFLSTLNELSFYELFYVLRLVFHRFFIFEFFFYEYIGNFLDFSSLCFAFYAALFVFQSVPLLQYDGTSESSILLPISLIMTN